MGECKKDITPLLTHWSYIFLALTHQRMKPLICLKMNMEKTLSKMMIIEFMMHVCLYQSQWVDPFCKQQIITMTYYWYKIYHAREFLQSVYYYMWNLFMQNHHIFHFFHFCPSVQPWYLVDNFTTQGSINEEILMGFIKFMIVYDNLWNLLELNTECEIHSTAWPILPHQTMT